MKTDIKIWEAINLVKNNQREPSKT